MKTEEAALDAEAATARAHIEDLQSLQGAMEGDREKKELLICTIREDNLRLEEEIAGLKQQQAENDAQNAEMSLLMQKTLESRAEAEVLVET